jgi:hypothetical protein
MIEELERGTWVDGYGQKAGAHEPESILALVEACNPGGPLYDELSAAILSDILAAVLESRRTGGGTPTT